MRGPEEEEAVGGVVLRDGVDTLVLVKNQEDVGTALKTRLNVFSACV